MPRQIITMGVLVGSVSGGAYLAGAGSRLGFLVYVVSVLLTSVYYVTQIHRVALQTGVGFMIKKPPITVQLLCDLLTAGVREGYGDRAIYLGLDTLSPMHAVFPARFDGCPVLVLERAPQTDSPTKDASWP